MQAVLVIDMIREFVTGRLGFPAARAIVPNIRMLVDAARKTGRPVVYVCDAHRPQDPQLRVWGEHAIDGTEGAEIIDDLAPGGSDTVIKKRTYSAFYGTDLHGFLQSQKVTEVVLTGVVTNICIQHTAADAFFRGYGVVVPEDSTAAVEEELHRSALQTMKQLYAAKIVRSADLVQEWIGK